MIRLFVVREEGGLIENFGPIAWMLSSAPIWGVQVGRRRLAYDTILKRYGLNPWRRANDAAIANPRDL